MERVFEILDRIQELWKQIEGLDPKTSQYQALIKQIRTLSDEYMVLIDAPRPTRTSNKSLPDF
jgi:hypothetical protein